jgi:hypothetical protein
MPSGLLSVPAAPFQHLTATALSNDDTGSKSVISE